MSNANMSAFPVNVTVHPEWNQEWQNGLTKREYFAAMAMQSLLNDPSPQYQDMNTCASDAVECADALIAALNKVQS